MNYSVTITIILHLAPFSYIAAFVDGNDHVCLGDLETHPAMSHRPS